MKYTGYIMIAVSLLYSFIALGASYEDLSDECSGQYLYLSNSQDGTPLEFVKLGTDEKWICKKLNSGKLLNVDPHKVEILPLYADCSDFDIVSFTAGYAIPAPEDAIENERRFNAYRQILRQHVSSRGDSLRACLGKIEIIVTNIGEIVKDKKGIKVLDADKIRELLDDCEALKMIQNMILDHDFQLAMSCYCRLRIRVLSLLKGKILPKYYHEDIEKILNDVGEELRKEYTNSRGSCQLRISQFQGCCPNVTGFWCQGSLFSELEIYQFARACFGCYRQTLEFSENLDFPNWGNAMLSVLQLFPKDDLISEQAALFDKCLKNYKTKYQLAN